MDGAGPTRQLTLLDCFGLGINGVIGSGIFLLPATMARRAGGRSPLAWLVVGGLCALVALCFAEAAGRTDRSGGPYRYARDAFGERVGFAVGWITLVSSLLGYAAVARGFGEHAGWFASGDRAIVVERAAAVALVVFLGALNAAGVKPSARAGDAMALVKLLGLFAFIAVGVMHIHASALQLAPAPHSDEKAGLGAAAFAGLFACTGFEYVPVPAGETRNPQRAVALALVLSVVGATVLYAIIQVCILSAGAPLAQSATPLVDAARVFAGGAGGSAMAAIALVSAFGFCAGSALVCPRYVELFANDGFLPPLLGRRAGRDVPLSAIFAVTILVAALACVLDFNRLADTSNFAVVVQYFSTALSVLVLRRRLGPSPGFRIPLGPLVPLAAMAGSALFLVAVAKGELGLAAALLAGGAALALGTRYFRRL